MNKKTIVTIYYDNDWNSKEDPIKSEPTRKSFERWHAKGFENGIEMYRASIQWYDIKTGTFSKGWAFRNNKWIKVEDPIKPDLVFDKVGGNRDYELFGLKAQMTKKVKVFNHPLFRTMLNNKLGQYMVFGEYMPKTTLATGEDDLRGALKSITTDKVVIKPLYGSGGFGIVIKEKNKVETGSLEYPVILQEFIKNNNGIPGFSNPGEIADLRMVFFNHEIKYALSRIAVEGSLFTNFHQGASAVLVPLDKIPKQAKEAADKIVEKLSIFPNAHYSLDFMFKEDGEPMLIEMNTTPGVDLLKVVGDESLSENSLFDLANLIK